MRLSELEPFTVAEVLDDGRNLIAVRTEPQLNYDGMRVHGIVLHDRGGYGIGESLTLDYEVVRVLNVRFEGIEEPQPVAPTFVDAPSDAWAGNRIFCAIVERALCKPHPQLDIAEVKRAYYNGRKCEWRTAGSHEWRVLRRYRYDAQYPSTMGVIWSPKNEYRIRPQENNT